MAFLMFHVWYVCSLILISEISFVWMIELLIVINESVILIFRSQLEVQ